MASKILITGGTGLVGSKLTSELRKKGHLVNILTTSATTAEKEGYYYWNIKDQYIDLNAFDGVEYIVHLAGAGVADKRWTEKRKKIILESRTKSTALLAERAKNHKLKAFLSASAVGIYGFNTGDKWLDEESDQGNDFLAEVVQAWEHEVDGFEGIAKRVVKLRIGIVLSTEGGALKEMLPPFKWGVGSPLGSGKQWMSWIHIDDLVDMFVRGIEKDLNGTYNAVGPSPVTNKEFSSLVAKTLGKPMWLPNVPSFILRLIFGELSQVVLGGNRVKSKKIEKAGFTFKFKNLESALKDLLNNR